jgi:hypothetical protein
MPHGRERTDECPTIASGAMWYEKTHSAHFSHRTAPIEVSKRRRSSQTMFDQDELTNADSNASTTIVAVELETACDDDASNTEAHLVPGSTEAHLVPGSTEAHLVPGSTEAHLVPGSKQKPVP